MILSAFGRFISALVLLCSTAFAADEWKAVFNPYEVRTLRLELSPADWDRVRHDQPSQQEGWIPQLAEARMWGEGETPIRVQIRRKGESDIPLPEGDPQKVSLKIDINALVDGQKWHGLNKLSLENGSDSPLTEGFAWIAHRLAWEAGIYGYEAAYSGWVKLYVNGELKGVYVNAEQRDAQFMRNHGYDKGPSTWLYKVDGSSSLEVGVGHSPAYNHLCFAPFNAGPGGGGGGRGCPQPILEEDLPNWINLRGFFTLGAVEAFVENRDGLFTHSGKNSYAVDFDPPFPNTRLYFPWDQDTTIAQGTQSIYGNEPYQQQLLMHPWFRQIYEQLLRDLTDRPFSVTALTAVIDRIQAGVGAAFDEDPYVYQGGSAEAFDSLRQWVQVRVPNVRSQLSQTFLRRPVLSHPGGEVVAGYQLRMTAPAGVVYYTTDGTDPRLPGGLISPNARAYTGPLVIERTTHVIARAFDGTLWTPLPVTATYNIARYANALRITELMYHPASGGTVGDEDNYEFIELKNTGASPLYLAGYLLDGVTYAFPAGTILQPGAFWVLARSQAAFSARYPGVTINGIYTGRLDDGGEKIRVRTSDGNTIASVEYDDDPPWPVATDGLGHSLVLHAPTADPDQPTTWRASSRRHGSPGADDPAPTHGVSIVINEVLAHTDPPLEDAIELRNLGNEPVDISGWYLSDDFVRTNSATAYDLKKFRIPPGTTIPAGGYKVFYERDFRANNPLIPFGLTEYGESVYLTAVDANDAFTGFIASATFPATANGISVGRHTTSRGVDFVPLREPTFGENGANASPLVGPLVINEIMYNPTGGGSEFLEFKNISAAPLDVSGWIISGASFAFPTGTTLPAGGLALLLKTNTTTVAAFRAANNVPAIVPIFEHDFALENEGEALRIEKPNVPDTEAPILIERVRYNDKAPWPTEADGEGPSLERFSATEYGNDPVNWRTVGAGGSPGRENQFNVGLAIAKSSGWKYLSTPAALGTAWRDLDYSHSGWLEGDGAFGNGAGTFATRIAFPSGMTENPSTIYFRKEFVVNDPIASIANLKLEAMYDDGFVAYLNGFEVARSSSMAAGAVTFDTLAATAYNSIGFEAFDLSARANLLRVGANVLAIEVHQASGGSDDVVWDGGLTYDVSGAATLATPVITPAGGSFARTTQVTIAHENPSAEIYYTLNGIDPDQNSTRYAGPITVTTTSDIRARAFAAGFNDSAVARAVITITPPQVHVTVSQQTFEVIVDGPPNAIYGIETSTDLVNWSPRATATADANGALLFTRDVSQQERIFLRITGE